MMKHMPVPASYEARLVRGWVGGSAERGSVKYGHEGTVDAAGAGTFLTSFLEGKLTPSYKVTAHARRRRTALRPWSAGRPTRQAHQWAAT